MTVPFDIIPISCVALYHGLGAHFFQREDLMNPVRSTLVEGLADSTRPNSTGWKKKPAGKPGAKDASAMRGMPNATVPSMKDERLDPVVLLSVHDGSQPRMNSPCPGLSRMSCAAVPPSCRLDSGR
jgi:hypothetical protein